jgi:HSP20 family protein
MKVANISPWRRHAVRRVPSLFADFDGMFDQFWPALDRRQTRRPAFAPTLDIHETDDALVLRADLPGLTADDFEIIAEEDVLTIRGERRTDAHGDEKADDGYRWSERSYGRFERAVRLPEEALVEQATAAYRDGVLTVSVPKASEPARAPHRIPVDAS